MTDELVEFVENVFEASTEEILRTIARAPGAILPRKEFVLGTMQDLWRGRSLTELEPMQPGGLRPVFPGSTQSITSDAVSREFIPGGRTPPDVAARRRAELQSLLLYAHAVAVPNPFGPQLVLGEVDDSQSNRLVLKSVPCSDEQFLLGLYLVCDLERLSRDGIVQYFDRNPISPGEYDLDELAASIGRALYSSYAINDFHQSTMKRAAIALLEQVVLQMAALSDEDAEGSFSDLLVPTDIDEDTFANIAARVRGLFLRAGNDPRGDQQGTTEADLRVSSESRLLSRLLKLELPGVEKIRLRDIANIRHDDAFTVFRSDMRTAVDAVDSTATTDAAHAVVADEMRAALARLGSKVTRGVISDALVAGAVGWAVGSTVAHGGWVTGGAALLGQSAAEIQRKRPSRSGRALRRHYVALSDHRLPRPRIRFSASGGEYVDRFWHVAAPLQGSRLAERRSAAVENIFDALGGDDGG